MDYWEDRLADNGKIDDYEKAIKAFRRSKKGRDAQNKAYSALQTCGLTSEECDEMINLEMRELNVRKQVRPTRHRRDRT